MLFLCDCYDQFTWSNPTRWNACLVCFSMQFLSDGARFVRLVVLIVSLFSSVSITCFLTFGDITFLRSVLLVIVVVPLSVFSLSEMLNALLISSLLRLVSTISSFIRLVTTLSSFIRLVSTISSFIRLVTTLPCLLTWVCLFFVLFFGTLLQEVYLLYMQYFFCLFLILVRPFVQFCSLLTKLYDIFRGNSHWPYSLTKYFNFTIV